MNAATALLARALAPLLPAPIGRAVRQAVKEAEREKAYQRGYEAAGWGPRYSTQSMMPSPVTETHGASPVIGSRAAFAVMNNPYMSAIKNAIVTDLVGPDGASLQHDNAEIVDAWNGRFFSSCDREGISTLAHLMGRGLVSWLCYGNAVFLMNPDPDDGSLKLLLINPEQVNAFLNEDFGEAGCVIRGIWVANDGRRLRYNILKRPPDHPFCTTAAFGVWRDAADVLHLHDPAFPGETWGVSMLAPILARANEVDLTEDAGLKLQQVAALMSVILSDPSGSFDLSAFTKPGAAGKLAEAGLIPGAVHLVPEGVTSTVITPPKSDSLVDFTKHMVRSLATGVGLPAWQVSGDLSDVNFSSARLGKLNWQRRAESLQRNILCAQFLDKVFARWLALEVIAGRLNVDLETVAPPAWIFPGWPSVDPFHETQADVLALSAGLRSRAEIISSSGRDPQQVQSELAQDNMPLPAAPAQAPRSTANA